MNIKTDFKAFTLIEIMIVIAIISILAAIAIPNYLHYHLLSKTSEAKAAIGGIKVCQESFKAEYDYYSVCSMNPAAVLTGKQAWAIPAAGDGWLEIGFQPAGSVYYTYEVAVGGVFAPAIPAIRGGIVSANLADNMCIGAAGDLDNNGTNGEFAFSTDSVLISTAGNILNNTTISNSLEYLTPTEF